MRPRVAPLLLLVLPVVVDSLLVVPSSPQCADLCGNTLSATSGAEMTCDDPDYATSTYGATFKACLTCELASTYYDTTTKQADLRWALYNIRYALSWCLFGFDNNTKVANTPCLTSFSCAPLQNAFEYDSMNPNATAYSFCPLFTASETSVHSCSQCLKETGNESYLSNFVTVLDAACSQQPTLGNTLSLQGSVFSSTSVNITTPSATPISTYNPHTGGLTLGAKIGIIVAGILVLMATTGFCIVWHGKRRRRAVIAAIQRSSGYAEWQAQNGAGPHGTPYMGKPPGSPFFDSPQSQRPLRRALSWDQGSPESQIEKAYFSPYSSQYTSPVSALEGPSHAGPWPMDNKGLGVAIEDTHPRDEIEMSNMDSKDPRGPGWQGTPPPVLQHPGNGRKAVDGDFGGDLKSSQNM